jgi:glycosyltransferase involved in cell wall biosynthesis
MRGGPISFACYYGAYSPELTGGPRTILAFLSHLDPARFRPVLVTHRESPLSDGARALGVPVELVPPPGLLSAGGGAALRYSWRQRAATLRAMGPYTGELRRVLRRHAVRGVWARNVRSVMLVGPAARREGVPLVWDIGLEKPLHGAMRLIHPAALLLSTRVVTQASVQFREVVGPRLARAFASRFRVITPGVMEERVALLRAALDAGRGARTGRVVLCLGSIHPRKNQMMLLRALPELAARRPDVVVRLAGAVADEGYARSLRDFVREQGLEERVQFLGWRDDVAELMAGADVLVLPSVGEGVPQTVREALYAELPVVATPVGGIPAAVLEGETGFLVPVGDHAALADRLARVLGDAGLRAAMGERAAGLARERFSIDRWALTYQELLEEVFG